MTPTLTPALAPSHTPSIVPPPTRTGVASQALTSRLEPTPDGTHDVLSEALISPLLPTLDATEEAVAEAAVPVYAYRIVNTYPHDREAFTQGLVVADGVLYEGTGRLGTSALREVDLESGQVRRRHALPEQYFGEGIAVVGDRIYQLTWHANLGFIYDRASFEQIGSFAYPTEGWGLTYDGQSLIMSDGTPNLYYLDPETLERTGQVVATYHGQPVWALNELEYVQGEVYANVWKTNLVVRIDPQTGEVVGVIDLTGLLSSDDLDEPVDVLNGIAYDEQADRLFVTGKLWPKLFEIELVGLE